MGYPVLNYLPHPPKSGKSPTPSLDCSPAMNRWNWKTQLGVWRGNSDIRSFITECKQGFMQKKYSRAWKRGTDVVRSWNQLAIIHPHLCLSKDVGVKTEKVFDQMDTHTVSPMYVSTHNIWITMYPRKVTKHGSLIQQSEPRWKSLGERSQAKTGRVL